jgi:hypothetical protein
MANLNWDRWIFASCSTFFDNRKNNYELYIEGQDRSIKKEEDYAELRYSGPYYQQFSPKNFKLKIELNVLINVTKDENDNHKVFRVCGNFESAFESIIPVYKYGRDPSIDTEEFIGCLQLVRNGDNDIIVTHFGQISPDVRVLQSTIEGHYEIDLSL